MPVDARVTPKRPSLSSGGMRRECGPEVTVGITWSGSVNRPNHHGGDDDAQKINVASRRSDQSVGGSVA